MDGKPLILSIETASLACSVALFQGEEAIAHRHEVDATYIHAERLLPLIDQVLVEAGKTHQDLQSVVVSAGPGSYTGLRISAWLLNHVMPSFVCWMHEEMKSTRPHLDPQALIGPKFRRLALWC